MPSQLCTSFVSYFSALRGFSLDICLHEESEGRKGGNGQHVKT